jgi:hypothetical protein
MASRPFYISHAPWTYSITPLLSLPHFRFRIFPFQRSPLSLSPSLFNFLCPSTLFLVYTYIINAIGYCSGFLSPGRYVYHSLTNPFSIFLRHVSQYFPRNEEIKVSKMELEWRKVDKRNRSVAISFKVHGRKYCAIYIVVQTTVVN